MADDNTIPAAPFDTPEAAPAAAPDDAPAPLMSAPAGASPAAPMATNYPSWIGHVNVNPQPASKPAMWNTVVQNAASAGVDPDVMWRMFGSERSYQDKPNPFQIMPATAAGLRRIYPSQNFGDPNDPVEGARMAPWALSSSNRGLTAALGHPPTPTEQYMGWVFGPKAVNVLKADPNTPIGSILPQEWIDRNPNKTAGPDGKPITPVTTAGELRWWVARRMGYDNPYSSKDVGDSSGMPAIAPAPAAEPAPEAPTDYSNTSGDWAKDIHLATDSSGPVKLDGVAPQVRAGLHALTQSFGPITLNSSTGGGHAEDSYHYRGLATDISIKGMGPDQISDLIVKARQSGFTGFGIGSTHLHVDMRSRPDGSPLVFGDAYSGPVAGLDVKGWQAKLAGVKAGNSLSEAPTSVSIATSSPLMPPTDSERSQRDAANYESGYGLAGGIYETLKNGETADVVRGLYNSATAPPPDPKFDATPEMISKDTRVKDMPEGWQENLLGATSTGDYENRVADLQRRQDYDQKIAQMGGKGTLAGLVGNLLDPTSLAIGAVPFLGEARGATILSKVLWGAGRGAASGALVSASDSFVNPTWTKDSLMWGAAYGALIGGALGPLAKVNPAMEPEKATVMRAAKGLKDTLDRRYESGEPNPKAPIATPSALEGGPPTTYGSTIPVTYMDPHGFESSIINRMNEIDPVTVAEATDLDTRIGNAQGQLAHMEANPFTPIPAAGRAARVAAGAAKIDPETMAEATRLDSATATARQQIADNEATSGHMEANTSREWLTKEENQHAADLEKEAAQFTGKRRSSPRAKAIQAELAGLAKKAEEAQHEALTRYGAETQGLRNKVVELQNQRGQLGPKVKRAMDAAEGEESSREVTEAQAKENHENAKAGLRAKIDQLTRRREALGPKIDKAEQAARDDHVKMNIRPLEEDNVMSTTAHLPRPEGKTVRFYHGWKDGAEPTSGGGRWATTDPEYARNFRSGEKPNNVSYVDVPKGHPTEVAARDWDELDHGTNKVGVYKHIEVPEELAQKMRPMEATKAPPHDSSVGAAQNTGLVKPVGPEDSVEAWMSGLVTSTYNKNKFAFAKVRSKLTNVGAFRSSDSPVEVALGTHGMADRVGNADHSALPLNTASEEMTHGMHAAMAGVVSRTRAAFKTWAKEKGYGWFERLKHEREFRAAVSDAITERDPSVRSQMNPHVLRAADAHSQFYGDYWEKMQNPGLVDNTQREALAGSAGVPKDSNYFPHLWDFSKFQENLGRFGDDGMKKLIRSSIAGRFGSQYTTEALDKMTTALFEGLKSHTFGQDISLSKMLSGDDMDGLAYLLRQHAGSTPAEIDNILGALSKPAEDGKIGRLKQRTPYNENAEVDLLDHKTGQMTKARLKDMLDWDALSVAQKYSRQLEGHLALARLRVENPLYDPTLHGPGAPAEGAFKPHLIDGLETQPKWESLAKTWRAVNGAMGMDRNVTEARIKHFELIRNKIAGIPDEFEHTKLAASMRILQNYNLSRVLNQVGFMHIPQAWQALSQAGLKAALKSMPMFRSFWRDAQTGQLDDKLSAMIEQSTGIGTDYLRGSSSPAPLDDWINGMQGTSFQAAERASGKLARLTTVVGGLAPMITSLQRWSARAAMVRFAQDAAGEKALNANRLAALGIDPAMQAKIADALRTDGIAKGSTGPNALANLKMDNWDPEVRHAFTTAITRWTNKMMQENDLGQMNMVFDKRFGKLLTQFRSFVFGSFENNTLHSLHMRDKEAVSNILGTTALGALSYFVQTHTQSIGREDRQEFLAKRLDFAHVAAAGILRGGWSSFAPAMVDTALVYGNHDPVFDERSSGQANGGLLSVPAAGLFSALQGSSQAVIGHVLSGEPISKRDVTNFRSTLPLGNWLPVLWAANAMSAGLPSHNTHLGSRLHR